ncbi:DUF6125 family protein [Chloroflexota bacterium]
MQYAGLETLSRETLINLVKMYSRNWQTLDGLWFKNVEEECGLEAAARIDLQNWEQHAVIEAKRIKDVLEIAGNGVKDVLMVLSFMSWQITSPLFEIEKESPGQVVIRYPRCAVQEGRAKQGKPVFPCKTMKLTLLSCISKVVNPDIRVRCLSCPPDAPGRDYWCRWELSLNKT